MNISYDKNKKEYILGEARYTKETFIKYIEGNMLESVLTNRPSVINVEDVNDVDYKPIGAENILLYGVPGCGKSYEIKTKYCNDDARMERTVFHPDYTYFDFVGQILPEIDENKNVTYKFEPGPFSRILKKAYENNGYYYLVIEEINRGNAPAVFGDIFQLLDRNESGESEYGISNEMIADYVYEEKAKKIKIPGNLFVLATMNTSDQNVFTLDTAFKRRWVMKQVKNDVDACAYADYFICDTNVKWGTFVKTINSLIIENNTENLSNEDNRLGAYFVKIKELQDRRRFAEKVLMYLWNDAFKFSHETIFKQDFETLDGLLEGFNREGFSVFNDNIRFTDMKNEIQIEADNANINIGE